MDTFFEQLVPIKKNAKAIILMVLIWILALFISVFLFLFLREMSLILVFGTCFGAYKLSSMLNLEYEYIITNGILDVDKITNKSSRKRLLSLDLRTVTRLEAFSPVSISNIDKKKLTISCNKQDNNALLLVAESEGKSSSYLVFSPDERLRSCLQKYVPKYIGNSILK